MDNMDGILRSKKAFLTYYKLSDNTTRLFFTHSEIRDKFTLCIKINGNFMSGNKARGIIFTKKKSREHSMNQKPSPAPVEEGTSAVFFLNKWPKADFCKLDSVSLRDGKILNINDYKTFRSSKDNITMVKIQEQSA